MTKKKVQEIKLVNEKLFDLIRISDKDLNQIARDNDITLEELMNLIEDYHNSLDKKMEFDKLERNELRELFSQIDIGLEQLRKEAESNLNLENIEKQKKDYAKVFNGKQWI